MILKNPDSQYQSMTMHRGSVGEIHEMCILLLSKLKCPGTCLSRIVIILYFSLVYATVLCIWKISDCSWPEDQKALT